MPISTVPAGSVIRTTPNEGTAVARGTSVTLVVSSGPPAQLDLLAHADDAGWTDGAGNPLTPGVDVDTENCGFVALPRRGA